MSNLEVNKRSEVILLAFSGKKKNVFEECKFWFHGDFDASRD